MRTKRLLIGAGVIACLLITATVWAQMSHPYKSGSVWNLAFIRMEPGMESAYLTYLATDWKKVQETMKSEGLIVSYKVITTESHDDDDWNVILMTEYKDLATMEANEKKSEAAAMKVVGSDESMRKGYKERLEIRTVVGDRMAREMILDGK